MIITIRIDCFFSLSSHITRQYMWPQSNASPLQIPKFNDNDGILMGCFSVAFSYEQPGVPGRNVPDYNLATHCKPGYEKHCHHVIANYALASKLNLAERLREELLKGTKMMEQWAEKVLPSSLLKECEDDERFHY